MKSPTDRKEHLLVPVWHRDCCFILDSEYQGNHWMTYEVLDGETSSTGADTLLIGRAHADIGIFDDVPPGVIDRYNNLPFINHDIIEVSPRVVSSPVFFLLHPSQEVLKPTFESCRSNHVDVVNIEICSGKQVDSDKLASCPRIRDLIALDTWKDLL